MINKILKINDAPIKSEYLDCLRKALVDFSCNASHENWVELSRVFIEKCPEEQESFKSDVFKTIAGHILSSK